MKRKRLLSALVAVVAMIFAAGCGGNGESSTDDQAASSDQGEVPEELRQLVEDAMSTPEEWPGPTTSPLGAKDKFIVSIPCARVAYGCDRLDQGARAAAKALGWKFQSVDAKGDPNIATQAINQAIDLGADGIFVGAMDPALLERPIAEARKAGIAVVDAVAAREPSPTGINHDVEIHGVEQGQALGAWVAVDSGGTAKVGVIEAPEFPHQALRFQGFEESLGSCAGCEIVAETTFTVTEIGTQLGPKSQSFLQSNPEIDYVYVAFDAAAGDVVAANQQTGGAGRVKVISYDANPQNIEFIEQGLQAASLGSPLDWAGWAAVDNLNRIFNGEDPLEDDGIPLRLITKENVEDFKVNGYGQVDFAAKYTQLWSTGETSTSPTAD